MSRFAVCVWRHTRLALAELALVTDTIDHIWDDWYSVTIVLPERLSFIAGIVKRWEIVSPDELLARLSPDRLVGVSDRSVGVRLKKTCWLKRFKEIALNKKDKDVVDASQEVHALNLDKDQFVWITGWQDIERFSVLDIEKPVRGMEVGMMPAKLTQIMVNIGVARWLQQSVIHRHKVPTLYDPFCGFGTTCFVANSLGYNAMGSDLRITSSKENLKRWKTTSLAIDRPITFFKHDALEIVKKPFIKHVNLIVTEWWLGPIMHRRLQPKEIQERVDRVVALWCTWLDTTHRFLEWVIIVCSLPSYQLDWREHILYESICTHAQKLGFSVDLIDVYKRPRQIVARQIVVFSPAR
jgi:hypothetical protein